MKQHSRFSIYMVLATLLLPTGCRQYDERKELSPLTVETEFSATTEQGEFTKTCIDENLHILWAATDSVSIFFGSERNQLYKVKQGASGSTGTTFSKGAWDNLEDDEFSAQSEYKYISANVALYPASRTVLCSQSETDGEYTVRFTIPEIEEYAENSFGKGSFPMVAVTATTNDKALKFKNICGTLRLSLKGEGHTVRSITITGNSDETLSGRATLTCSNTALPQLSLDDEGQKSITLDCGDGVQLNADEATLFYIPLPPVTFANGFIAVIRTDDKVFTKSTSKQVVISRSGIKRMAQMNLDEVSSFTDLDDIGIYDLANLQTTVDGWVSDGTLPYALAHGAEEDLVEIYSFQGDSLIRLTFPTSLKVNSEATVEKLRITSSSESGASYSTKVVKIYGNKLWLKTTDNKLGFILEVEE